MIKKLFISILLFTAVAAFGHEFWLFPSQFRVAVGDKVSLAFWVGEDFQGERWEKRRERTRSLRHFFAGKSEDLTPQALGGDSSDIEIQLLTAGTHIIAMNSKNSFIELDGEKFEAYLVEDGIDNIRQLRKEKGETAKPARELYQRCAKTLIQVGDLPDRKVSKKTGLPLEIIPLKNPYALSPGDALPVKILFEGKPLAGASVRSWHKTEGSVTAKNQFRSNANGIAQVLLTARGFWMVSLVHMTVNADKTQSDYQSYWGSLTFEL